MANIGTCKYRIFGTVSIRLKGDLTGLYVQVKFVLVVGGGGGGMCPGV